MPGEASGKICYFCSESCAGQPRGKDPRGRYYHKACLEAARHEAEKPALAAPTEPEFAADADQDMLADLFDEAPTKPAGRPCPQCGTTLAAQAVLCTSCGYNAQSGHRLKVKIGADRGPSRPVWPIVIGIVSLLMAVGGLGFAAIEAIGGGDDGSARAASLIGIVIRVLLALYLLVGGFQLVKRNPMALSTLRQWAIAKIVLTVVCGGTAIALMAFAGAPAAIENDFGSVLGVILATLIVLCLVALIWPIFLLIWFNRDAVTEEVNRW